MGEQVVFPEGRFQKEHKPRRKPEPLPKTKEDRITELIELYQIEARLPIPMADLTPEEEVQLDQWANSLSFKELGQEIRKRRRKLDKDWKNLRDQIAHLPRGLVRF